MAAEPDFCRDILETRIKGILKEHLKISRDISFLQVWTWQGVLPWVWLFRWRGLTLLQRWMEPYPALSVLPPGKTRRTYCDKPSCWKVVVSTSLRTSLIRTVSSWSPSRHLGLLCVWSGYSATKPGSCRACSLLPGSCVGRLLTWSSRARGTAVCLPLLSLPLYYFNAPISEHVIGRLQLIYRSSADLFYWRLDIV